MESIDVIRNLCKQKGISISALEKELGFGNGSLGKAKKIPAERIRAIARYFNVSMEYLMTGEDQPYYADKETDELYEAIQNNSDIKFLLSASRSMDKKDLEAVINIVKRMKGIES